MATILADTDEEELLLKDAAVVLLPITLLFMVTLCCNIIFALMPYKLNVAFADVPALMDPIALPEMLVAADADVYIPQASVANAADEFMLMALLPPEAPTVFAVILTSPAAT